MSTEIEAKMRFTDLDAIRRRLRDAGATPHGMTFETNRFFDAEDHALGNGDQGLRLRTNLHLDTNAPTHVVTFKGARQKGKFKTREELEFATDNVEATSEIFKRLGFAMEFSFEKRRESWSLDDCKIELDELPRIGTFVEVEGPSEASVEAVRAKLALLNEAPISEGYASMVWKQLQRLGGKHLGFNSAAAG